MMAIIDNVCVYTIAPEPWSWRRPFSTQLRLTSHLDMAGCFNAKIETLHDNEMDARAELARLVIAAGARVVEV